MADQTFAVNCGFFDAINSDRVYSADEMNRPYKRVISNGVFATPSGTPSTDLQVTASSGMNIICKKGEGLFGDKWFENPSGIAITVPSNTGTVPRIDSVLVQVDTRTSGRVGNIVYRTGTPASSPVPPAINQTEGVVEYRLANIRVNAGVSAITGSMITDRRGSSDCPWVTSLIYQVDTSTLYDQWQAAYAEYFEEEKAIWDAWYAQLTEDLDVSMTLDRHVNTVITTATTTGTIPIGLAYNHNTDILEVYINGLRAVEGTHYVVVDGDTSIQVENQLDIGQAVTFVVMRSVISGSATNITVLLQELESQIAGIAGGTPTVVDSTSDMTDTEKIYILSSDSKWYYYSATQEDWVIGGTYGGVPTDTTLTQRGMAADAKTVGDALALKADADDVDALDTRVTAVEGDVSDLTEDLNVGYITKSPIVNGSFNSTGLTTGNSKKIRTDLIPVKIGDKIVIDNGTLKHACGAWRDSVSTANNVRNDISFNPLGESIISTINGYYVVAFTKQDDTQDISLSDFDGYVHVYSSGIYRNAESISKINSRLDDLIDKAYENVSIGDIGTKIAGYSFGTDGANVSGASNASYDSYYFYTDKDTAMYFASSAPSSPTYIALTVGYDPAKTWTITDSVGTMKMLCTSATRKRKSENNLPVQASPMDVSDAIVIITVNTNTTTSFNINSKLLLDADVALSSAQVEQVISSIPEWKCPKLQYRSVSEWENEKSSEQVDIYLPTDNGYVRYAIGHSIDANTNANSWRILRALATDNTLTDRFAITTHGEWEMAVKLNGGTDFIGGILHGDEVLDSIRFYVDGKLSTISAFTAVTNFTELRIVEFTDMYDPDAQTDKVAEHIKEYIFTADGLTLNQQIKWLMAKTLTTSYCCMFPLIRGNDTVSELQVTGKYYDNNDYKEYDVSVGGFEGYPATWHTGVTIAHLYASASGVFATAEMVKQPSLTGGDRSFLQNTTNQYNKLYYAICGINNTCDVSVNDKWEVTSKYAISVT